MATSVSAGVINGIETGKNENPSSKNLAALADFYDVSCDFLLGRTDIEKLDETAQHVNATYGLSESSLKILKYLVTRRKRQKSIEAESDIYGAMNALLSSSLFPELIFHMVEARECHLYTSPEVLFPSEQAKEVLRDIPDYLSDAQNKVVRLSPKQAAKYHSQEAARLLQSIITAYCKSGDEKPKEQQIKKRKGDNDNG